jgi:iron complex transport system ATP-binding protein
MIVADNVGVILGGKTILRELDFEVGPGEWIGLLGPNGAGKTTLLKALAGLLPCSGSLSLDGIGISDWKPRDLARRIAFVRQSHSLSFDFRVEELVLLGRSPHKSLLSLYETSDRERVIEALEMVDLSGFSDRVVLSLSGGELQRVFLAQALVQEADILLLDEPTTHLDVHHEFEFLQRIRRLVDSGRTIIGAFHNLEMASRFCDRLIVLKRGKIEADGRPGDVLSGELIAGVFQMQSTLETMEDGSFRIRYTAPVQ